LALQEEDSLQFVDESESMTRRRRPLGGWISRSLRAMQADLGSVECGSLDVLLYCADDIAVGAGGDSEIDRPLRSTTPRLSGRQLSIT
jgi:hypothetical protein